MVVDGAFPCPIMCALRQFIDAGLPTDLIDVEARREDLAVKVDADLMCVLGLDEADGCGSPASCPAHGVARRPEPPLDGEPGA